MATLDPLYHQERGVRLLLADLKACTKTKNLEWGKQIHSDAVQCGRDSSIYVASALINMYAKCGSMREARQVFDAMAHPDVVSWTVLILGYAENGEGLMALDLFTRMKTAGIQADSVTLVGVLKAWTSVAVRGDTRRDWGKALHNLAVETGCESNIYVQSALINMYAKCGSMVDARQIFDCMKHPDVVCLTVIILGYADSGEGRAALELFKTMKSNAAALDSVTLVAAVMACTSLVLEEDNGCAECIERGKALHTLAMENGSESNVYVQSALIDMYAKCGSMLEAAQAFDSMRLPNVVSWTALILGYANNGQSLTALNLFTRMKTAGPAPNSVTFSAVLKACTFLGAVELGRTVHFEIGDQLDAVLVNCLVDLYAKCGSPVEAQCVFNLHTETRDLITWNALLSGFSTCGDAESVFRLFEEMQDAGFRPDGVTFLWILTCCGRAGLVVKGQECFDAMSSRYGVVPGVEHYTCMLNIFGLANQLDSAMALLQVMPCSSDDVTWMTILSACCKWKNVEIGRLAFQSLISCNEGDAAGYVLMGQIYGSRGMLQEQEIVMGMRHKLGEG